MAAAGAGGSSPTQRRQQQQQQTAGARLPGSPPDGQGLTGLLGLNSPPLSPMQRAALAGLPGPMQRSLLGSSSGLADLAAAGHGPVGGVGSPGGLLLQGYGYGGDGSQGPGGGGNGGSGAALVYGGGLGMGGFGSTGNLSELLGLMQGGPGGYEGGLYEDLLPPVSAPGGGLHQQQQHPGQGRGSAGGH